MNRPDPRVRWLADWMARQEVVQGKPAPQRSNTGNTAPEAREQTEPARAV